MIPQLAPAAGLLIHYKWIFVLVMMVHLRILLNANLVLILVKAAQMLLLVIVVNLVLTVSSRIIFVIVRLDIMMKMALN